MNTEITDNAGEKLAGWIFYDGECPLCLECLETFAPALARNGFQFAPLQTPWVQRRLGLVPDAPLTEMRALFPDGSVAGGADALVAIARRIWWGWPLFLFAKIPGVLQLMRFLYIQIAARRTCAGGRCAIRRRLHVWGLVVFPCIVLGFRNLMPAWIFMWALTLAIFFGCKLLTWPAALTRPTWKMAGYFLAWPGMDAEAFLGRRNVQSNVNRVLGTNTGFKPWLPALTKLCLGALLVSLAGTNYLELGPLMTGWMGIAGVITTLHFGVGDLLALGWRRLGVNCTPLMLSPIRATSLAEFWGRRWNTGFSRLAREFLFKPLAKRWGIPAATVLIFVVSGLIHELVISVPARGGYGLPTIYFAIQGLGMLVERSKFGDFLGLGSGFRGWMFTAILLIAPLCCLCPPVFIQNVILPMLHVIGGRQAEYL